MFAAIPAQDRRWVTSWSEIRLQREAPPCAGFTLHRADRAACASNFEESNPSRLRADMQNLVRRSGAVFGWKVDWDRNTR
jgi:hypothetical protein